MIRKCSETKHRKGEWLVGPCRVRPFRFSHAGNGRFSRSEYWPVFSPQKWPFSHAKVFQLKEIEKQPARLSNSESCKFIRPQNSRQRVLTMRFARYRNARNISARRSDHLIHRSSNCVTKTTPPISPIIAKPSEKMSVHNLAYIS